MDYETFGEHQWEDTGIFDFLRVLPETLMRHPETTFKTPSETILAYDAMGEYDVPDILTWADTDRDLTAWTGNDIQQDALHKTYALEDAVLATNDAELIERWRKLQTSDHFYYMCTKWSNDGDVHAYFSPYQSPYDAYISFMNALSDLKVRVDAKQPQLEAPVVVPETVELDITLGMLMKASWRHFVTASAFGKIWQRTKRAVYKLVT
jgi:alpha-amylase